MNLLGCVGYAQPTEADLRALATVYSLGVVGSFTRDWCIARAPQTRTAVTNGYNAWLKDTRLDVINQKASAAFGSALNDLKTSLESKRQEVYAELDRAAKNPAQECQGIRAVLGQQMNPQKLAPGEYALALKVQVKPAQATASASAPAAASPAAQVAANGSESLADDYDLPSGSKVGGTLALGTYNCSHFISQKYGTSYWSVSLYAGNEYRRMFDANKTPTYDTDSGSKGLASYYEYNLESGWLSLYGDDYFKNAKYRAESGRFGLFYTDPNGKPVLYAEDSGTDVVTCTYAGANKFPAPSALKAQKVKQDKADSVKAEQERNRYRTAPNAGLKLSQIKTIIHDYSSGYNGQNIDIQEDDTLLLNDGTAYLNLRWTPHDLDVKASRAGEPQKWTRWRYQGGYQILKKGQWVKLEGMVMAPFSKGERISGAYSYKSYYKVGWYDNASVSYSESNLYFNQDGTFDTGRLSRTTGGTDMGGIRTSGVAQSTDSGTKGTYTADGYTLQLKYADGTVQRSFGFFWNGDKKRLVINGTTYSR